MSAAAVTGYVRIPDHPRSEASYRSLLAQLKDTGIALKVYEDDLDDCWLKHYLGKRRPKHATADDPWKNSLAYHCVQAQKSDWLQQALQPFPDDVLVWIDAGIFHLPGMTAEIVRDFMSRAATETEIAVPGCWDDDYIYSDLTPCWRFCGGVMIVPRKYVDDFDYAMKLEYKTAVPTCVTWDVNILARVESRARSRVLKNPLPIRQYRANHDHTMFTNYRPTEHADG
jgi:hypothetical protein